MTAASESDVRKAITPEREAKIVRAFRAAWKDVQADQARYGRWPRTRANMVFERLSVRLQEEFIDDTGIRFFFSDETVKIGIDDIVLGRAKKANGRGLGQNVTTQANLNFCEAQEELPGFVGLQKVEIVYVVNRFGTAISEIVVQARDGDVRLWAFALTDEAAAPEVPVIPLPPLPPAPPSDGSDLVHPRTKPVEKEDTDKK
jgi:hypothetical protein